VGRAPVASDAELKMAREVKMLQLRVDQLRGAVDQLKEKEKYQRYQVPVLDDFCPDPCPTSHLIWIRI
jgi:hypothetical protein